jgi:hypothetical protein
LEIISLLKLTSNESFFGVEGNSKFVGNGASPSRFSIAKSEKGI